MPALPANELQSACGFLAACSTGVAKRSFNLWLPTSAIGASPTDAPASAEAHRDNLAPSYCCEPCRSGTAAGGESRRERLGVDVCASLPHRAASLAQSVR